MSSSQPRVKSIRIDGLFGQYDHSIPLNHEDRVTILHGRNGVGKTVTLSLVAALLKGNYSRLAKIPFSRLRIEFSEHSFIEARPAKQEGAISEQASEPLRAVRRGKVRTKFGQNGRQNRAEVSIDYALSGVKQESFLVSGTVLPEEIARNFHWMEPIDDYRWIDRRVGDVVSTEDALQRYADALPVTRMRTPEPEPFRALRKRVPVHFIEAQRLFKITRTAPDYYRESPSVTSAVEDIAKEMAIRIKEVDSNYRATSTRLDDSLPSRLFASVPSSQAIPEVDLSRRTETLEKERRRLHEIGLVADTTSFSPSTLNETQRAMFAVYLKDNEEKLSVFKELADRAEILLGIINRKFQPKKVKIGKDKGYNVSSHDGRMLGLDMLSSGEQHELVLLHDLLFRVEPGALLLIDEPELSLHVTWQTEFLEELIQITNKVGFDALVATHSPYIVGSRRDLMVRLGEPL